MAGAQKNPLRQLTPEEQHWLERLSRSQSEPASQVARARQILSVSAGHSYCEAARLSGRKSGDAVAKLVARFNGEGLCAIVPRHGGGPSPKYGPAERERILREVRRAPDPEEDGTATWSLRTLCQALRRAPDGLPEVSEDTIRTVMMEAGLSWQRSRSWCETGQASRRRKAGRVAVVDVDAEGKKS